VVGAAYSHAYVHPGPRRMWAHYDNSTITTTGNQLSRLITYFGGQSCRTLVVLSFSEQLPIVHKAAQERIKRRRRGTNYSLSCLLHWCVNGTLKYKSPDLVALVAFPSSSYPVPITLSSYPSLPRSISHQFTPHFSHRYPAFLHRYPALVHRYPASHTIHRVVYPSVIVPERVPVNYNK